MRHLLTFIYFSWVYLLSAQPNLVIILTDDQGYKDVGFNGCEDIPTPYIDNIAKMGANCTNGYVTYPVCGPSRASLMTGMRPDHTQVLDLKTRMRQKNPNILIAGDFNIIPEELDVHDFKRYENDALGRLEIRKKYREIINLGFKDVYRFKNKSKQEYTFWDYFAGSWQKNYGMRIDHFLLSNSLIENIKSININKKPRSKAKPSDHTPIELEII